MSGVGRNLIKPRPKHFSRSRAALYRHRWFHWPRLPNIDRTLHTQSSFDGGGGGGGGDVKREQVCNGSYCKAILCSGWNA